LERRKKQSADQCTVHKYFLIQLVGSLKFWRDILSRINFGKVKLILKYIYNKLHEQIYFVDLSEFSEQIEEFDSSGKLHILYFLTLSFKFALKLYFCLTEILHCSKESRKKLMQDFHGLSKIIILFTLFAICRNSSLSSPKIVNQPRGSRHSTLWQYLW